MRLLILCLILLVSSPAYAQYSAARAQNAPTEEVKKTVTTDTGLTREVYVEQKVRADRYGNAAGSQYDLAVDGAFEGQTVAVLHFYTGEGFDFGLPKAALAEKGFSVFRWINKPPSPAELEAKLEKACQLWVISGASRQLSDAHVAVIKRFFESGKGVYIWGDNPPYFGDANAVAQALFGAHMSGNTQGEQQVGVKTNQSASGLAANHDITTGIENLYEGHTIATLQGGGKLTPLIHGSAGNLVAAYYDKKGRRAILDGGFTRLYHKWDTAGTGRYVKNAAAWLVNYERFGDAVVGKKSAQLLPKDDILLDFDDFAAPSTFAEAPGFREAYRSADVIFQGGMEVVNEDGNFGVLEHSSPAFLAWNNTSSGNESEEALNFTAPVSNVRFMTGSREPGTVTATAYDAKGKVLAMQTIELMPTVMPVVLEADNISTVVITATATYGVIDDVRYTRTKSSKVTALR